MRITVLAGGVGGARFALGLREAARALHGDAADIRIVANVGDDMWLAGVKVCPDLDSLMYALAGVGDTERGWGRAGESERVAAELAAYGVGWPWFTLGDLDLGTHLARSSMLRDGASLTEATARLSARWELGARLLPVTNDEVPTHVVTGEGVLHFEEWWVRTRAELPAHRFVQHGLERSRISHAAREAIATADVLLIAPSNPVVSIGTILGIPGVRDALETAAAPVVGVAPLIAGRALRGMAATCLQVIGVEADAAAVAAHYGARRAGGLLDGWLLAEEDAGSIGGLAELGIVAEARPLLLTPGGPAQQVAEDALALAERVRAARPAPPPAA
ncbi:2-phospho-L-lactate transferase [Agrococcus sp. TF02-05]|uniref:2-phospho-L-lactate transferase n=1 Tax=Agrococcus sp. TF02-05 TaxID=2815211 RepID=UPI001AA1D089|nr:2-phospho-L-lactate transferase [Agrococcus sp. TF02-05]MBO1769368.1 2-phospho-L-lactate transferase [Agrococcus sp. TF02-05]